MNNPKSTLVAAFSVAIAVITILPARADQLQQEIDAKQKATVAAVQQYQQGASAGGWHGMMEMNRAVKQLLTLPIMPVRTEGNSSQLTVIYAEYKPGARDQELRPFLDMRVHDKRGRLTGGRWTLESRHTFPTLGGGSPTVWVVVGTLDFVGR